MSAKSKAEHTPGPWRCRMGRRNKSIKIDAVDGSWIQLASVWITPTSEVEANANANVIAAAPDYHREAYKLAMVVLQSAMYQEGDVREHVDNILAIHARVENNL